LDRDAGGLSQVDVRLPDDALHLHRDVVQAQHAAERCDRVDAPVGVGHRPGRGQGGDALRPGRGGARAAARRAAGQARRDGDERDEPRHAAWSSTWVCSSLTDSPSIERNTNPTPTPSRASISWRPIENVRARLAGTPYRSVRLVAVAPWNTPRLPGVMGKSCTRFDARKTTAATPRLLWMSYAARVR